MSLTSYRAAPPRAKACEFGCAKPQAGGRDRRRSRQFQASASTSLPQARGLQMQTRRRSAARCVEIVQEAVVLGRPGNDLLSRVLRHSTIGAEEFNGRVRDGIGFLAPRSNHRTGEGQRQGGQGPHPELCSSKVKISSHHPQRSRTARSASPNGRRRPCAGSFFSHHDHGHRS